MEASVLKKNTSYQVARWPFGNFFVPFGIPKMIVVDARRIFYGMFRNKFPETLLILVYEVARVNYKAVVNKGFHR